MPEERTLNITCDECGYSEMVLASRLPYEEGKMCPSCRKGKMWWVPPAEEARRREVRMLEEERQISPAVIIIPLGLGLGLVAALAIAAMVKAASPTPSPGRATLYGKVTDADIGDPVAGALLTLDTLQTSSDAGGNYSFADVDPGNYQITVERDGYNVFSQAVALTEGANQLNIQLVPTGAPPEVADIRVESLVIAPTEVYVGEPVQISVTATNYGAASVSKTIMLSVNGTVSEQTVALESNQSKQVNFEVTPTAAKTYQVMVDGQSGSFRAAAPTPPSYGALNVQIVSYPPAPGWQTPIVHCNLTNPTASKISATIKLKVYGSVYVPQWGLQEIFRESPGQAVEIPAGGTIEYLYDGTVLDNAILLSSGDGAISWQLWLEDNHGGRSGVYEFTT
jgi:hypothetical protein